MCYDRFGECKTNTGCGAGDDGESAPQYTEITVAVVARCVGIPAPVVLFTQGVWSPSWVKSIFSYVVKMSVLMFCGMFL